jgi:hypothetical protein
MEAARKSDISKWFDSGVIKKHDRMIIVCDTYNNEDYFVFLEDDDFWDEIPKYLSNMQKVMEVYDLKMSKEFQMAEFRAFHTPPKPQNINLTL